MLRQHLEEIESNIQSACARAGRSRESVRLIAVSKTQPVSAIEEAYALGRDRNTIKRMYFLAETETDETLKARFRRELPEMRDSEKARWEEQLREVTSRGATGREAKEVAAVFAEQDETKRRALEEKIIAQWREEYRSMV